MVKDETANLVAFALRDEYAGTTTVNDDEVPTFQGGNLALSDGSFDVAEQLDESDYSADDGRKILVIDAAANQSLADLLRAYPALKSVPVPEGATAVVSYQDQTMVQLRAEAQRRRFEHIERRKPELAARLEAHDHALAAGEAGAETAEQIRKGDATPTDGDDQAGDDAGETNQGS